MLHNYFLFIIFLLFQSTTLFFSNQIQLSQYLKLGTLFITDQVFPIYLVSILYTKQVFHFRRGRVKNLPLT